MTHTFAKSITAAPTLAAMAAFALIAAPPAFADEGEDASDAEITKGEEKLARLLEGRVAGEPVDCIRIIPSQSFRSIEETAYVYGRGRTIYVQRTSAPEAIDRNDILVTRPFSGTRLCRLDFATTVDNFTGFFTGGVQFEQFVPYTRADKDEG